MSAMFAPVAGVPRPKVKPPVNPAKSDPLVKATRKAYRASAVGQLETLLKEERRWKSKETMASNKLREVRGRISGIAFGLATLSDMRGETGSIAERVAKGGDK